MVNDSRVTSGTKGTSESIKGGMYISAPFREELTAEHNIWTMYTCPRCNLPEPPSLAGHYLTYYVQRCSTFEVVDIIKVKGSHQGNASSR